jgi:excisionase family DNA binding protein
MQLEMPMIAQPEEELLTTSKVAKMLGVTQTTISQWADAGFFPHAFRLSPRRKSPWRIPKADVEAFIARQRAAKGFFYTPTTPPDPKAE